MNKDIMEGKWNEVKGKVKEKWGKLTDNDITQINGKKEALLGKLQSIYGYDKERATQEISNFEKTFSSGSSKNDTRAQQGASTKSNANQDMHSQHGTNAKSSTSQKQNMPSQHTTNPKSNAKQDIHSKSNANSKKNWNSDNDSEQ